MRVSPAAIVPSAQGNGVVQAPAFDRNVNSVGTGSSTVTPLAGPGPWVVSTVKYPSVCPGATLACPTFVISRSNGAAITGVLSVATLSVGSSSGDVLVIVAMLAMGLGVVYPAGTANVVTITRVSPGGIVPSAQGNGVVQEFSLRTN